MNWGGRPRTKTSGGGGGLGSSGASGLFDEQREREDVAAGGETGFREERDVVSNVSMTVVWCRCRANVGASRTDRRGVTSCLWAGPTQLTWPGGSGVPAWRVRLALAERLLRPRQTRLRCGCCVRSRAGPLSFPSSANG